MSDFDCCKSNPEFKQKLVNELKKTTMDIRNPVDNSVYRIVLGPEIATNIADIVEELLIKENHV